jgi:hypothetical protein
MYETLQEHMMGMSAAYRIPPGRTGGANDRQKETIMIPTPAFDEGLSPEVLDRIEALGEALHRALPDLFISYDEDSATNQCWVLPLTILWEPSRVEALNPEGLIEIELLAGEIDPGTGEFLRSPQRATFYTEGGERFSFSAAFTLAPRPRSEGPLTFKATVATSARERTKNNNQLIKTQHCIF